MQFADAVCCHGAYRVIAAKLGGVPDEQLACQEGETILQHAIKKFIVNTCCTRLYSKCLQLSFLVTEMPAG